VKVELTHSTTACVLLRLQSLTLLTDPVLDTGLNQTYELGPRALATRRIGPALAEADLTAVDAVLLSHTHHLDNLDEAGLQFTRNVAQVVLGPTADPRIPHATVLEPWRSMPLARGGGPSLTITAIPVTHGPRWFPGATHGVGYVLQPAGEEGRVIYISGDTTSLDTAHEVRRRFGRVDLALLHLGGVHFWPPWPPCLRFTYTAYRAAQAAAALDASRIVPIHYERSVWSHFKERLEDYQHEFADRGLGSRVTWLRPGQALTLEV
jgi:L-ascorbate metabolism protein UlaG (beta-lactamase superfamily)